jgi:hypothetical protein
MDQILKEPLENYFKWPKFRTPVWPDGLKPDLRVADYANFKLCEPKKRIGIEIEVENLTVGSVEYDRYIWVPKNDGSLRNNGLEFVSLALAGHEIVYAVDNFYKNLPRSADFSERTSIHIHANMRDQTVGQLLTTLMLYTTFEQLLFEFAGPQRRNNIFCVSVQETRYPYLISDFFKNQSLVDLTRDWKKYSGLNLRSLRNLGTIEYRIMEGHNNPRRLLNWINIILRMSQYARHTPFEAAFESIKMLNTTSMYEQFMREVFREDADLLLNTGRNLQQLLETGVSTIKAFTMESDFRMGLSKNISPNSSLLKKLGVKEYPKAKKHDINYSDWMQTMIETNRQINQFVQVEDRGDEVIGVASPFGELNFVTTLNRTTR